LVGSRLASCKLERSGLDYITAQTADPDLTLPWPLRASSCGGADVPSMDAVCANDMQFPNDARTSFAVISLESNSETKNRGALKAPRLLVDKVDSQLLCTRRCLASVVGIATT